MPTIANVNLTDKEAAMIRDILTDDYNSRGIEGSPWSWSVVDGCRGRAAVLGSLVKKGLVYTDDWGGKGRNDDQICGFTDEGKNVAQVVWEEVQAEWAEERAARDAETSGGGSGSTPAELSEAEARAQAAEDRPEPCLTRECVEAGTDWPTQTELTAIERQVSAFSQPGVRLDPPREGQRVMLWFQCNGAKGCGREWLATGASDCECGRAGEVVLDLRVYGGGWEGLDMAAGQQSLEFA